MGRNEYMKKTLANKKLWLGMLVLALVFAVAVASCDNGLTNYDTTLVCFGDSLTAGYGATVPFRENKSQSYPAFLQRKVNAHSIRVVNAGVSGDTTAQGLDRVYRDVLSKDPQIVIILLGANDFLKPILNLTFTNTIPVNETQDNLKKIIDKINNENIKIYLAKFYTDAMVKKYPIFSSIATEYDAMFDALATSSNNITLIEDIWTGVWGVHMSDPIHPNAEGYRIMANNIYNALKL